MEYCPTMALQGQDMELSDLKLLLQEHLTDGLVILVGSGLSAAAGLATMSTIAEHLLVHVPNSLGEDEGLQSQWSAIASQLQSGADLETAFTDVQLEPRIEEQVIALTAELISEKEQQAIRSLISGKGQLPLSDLFCHILKAMDSVEIVTTNYDCLVEMAAEVAGFGADCQFLGQNYGEWNPETSRQSLMRPVHKAGNRREIRFVYRKHVRVFKPQGSVDWYVHDGRPIRCTRPVSLPRLMITPGAAKYLKGYDQPFDRHRENANYAIDRAARFLIIGYGFNDHQLETHLRPKLQSGARAIILTKTLTPNARQVVTDFPDVVALTEGNIASIAGTHLEMGGQNHFYQDIHLWDLANFISEVI